MKKQIGLSALLFLVVGCVSDSDLVAVQSQVKSLNAKLAQVEEELVSTKNELSVVKGQRLIRLPTGAPTQTEERAEVSSEEMAYQNARALYKSGDTAGAILAFEQFNAGYPNSSYQQSVLFYLAQASYTVRDFSRAQQLLEELVYQSQLEQINLDAVNLLKRVYNDQGNSEGLGNLEQFLQSARTQSAQTQSVEESASPNRAPSESINAAGAMRPSTIGLPLLN